MEYKDLANDSLYNQMCVLNLTSNEVVEPCICPQLK